MLEYIVLIRTKYSDIYDIEMPVLWDYLVSLTNSNFSEEIKNKILSLEFEPSDIKVNLVRMCEILGLNTIKNPYMVNSGHFEDRTITINSTENIFRQRFTLAHELSHFLNGDKDWR